jgi:hypothetical protein
MANVKVKKIVQSNSVVFNIVSNRAARVTFGWRKIKNMVQVAVSYCAEADKFSHKIGRGNVLYSLENSIGAGSVAEGVISLPMRAWEDREIRSHLEHMFYGFETNENQDWACATADDNGY